MEASNAGVILDTMARCIDADPVRAFRTAAGPEQEIVREARSKAVG